MGISKQYFDETCADLRTDRNKEIQYVCAEHFENSLTFHQDIDRLISILKTCNVDLRVRLNPVLEEMRTELNKDLWRKIKAVRERDNEAIERLIGELDHHSLIKAIEEMHQWT
jgi:hypothetical protein